MKESKYLILIHKSLTNTLNNIESAQLQQWLKNPENVKIYEEVKLIWDYSDEDIEPVPDIKKKIERAKLLTRLKETKKQESKAIQFENKIRIRDLLISILVFMIGVLSFWVLYGPETIPATTTIAIDKQRNITLADSSGITLNNNSSISISDNYDERKANLIGEAYFNISENKLKPFIVHAGSTTIEVTGTKFFVKAPPQKPVKVVLMDGQVKVAHLNRSVILNKKNEMAFVDEKLIKTINEDPNFNSWYTGKLIFDNTEFIKVLNKLEKQYDVSFKVDSQSLLSCRFSGNFNKTTSLNVILKMLSYSLDFKYKWVGTHYRIYGNGCKQ